MEKNVIEEQRQKIFFDPTPERKFPHLPTRPTKDEVAWALSRFNDECALNNIIVSKENEGNMRILRRYAFTSHKRFNRSCRGMSFGIYAQSGQGKTYVVKQWAKTIGIPFVFVQSDTLSGNYALYCELEDVCEDYGTPLVPQASETEFVVPPVIVFFDEAHSLSKRLMEGSLLNAMEYGDGWMTARSPGRNGRSVTVDCRNVCWIAATTERGRLFPAFESRFETHLTWHPAGADEIFKIVRLNYPDMPHEACRLISKYCRVPRFSLAFARQIQMEQAITNCIWSEAAATIAEDNGIDDFGMTYKQVMVLKAVGQRPISKVNLCSVSRCKVEELERFILPALTEYSNGGPFVVPSRRGYTITKSGIRELNRRDIANNGDRVTIEYFESNK